MKLKKIIHTHNDWLLLTTLLLLVSILGVSLLLYFGHDDVVGNLNGPKQYGSYEATSDLYQIVPPDAKYPPPATEQRSFYKTYDAGDVQYNLVWATRNMSRSPDIGQHVFTLELYNSRNGTVTLDETTIAATTIGCIARENPYRAVTVVTKPMSFTPYERKTINFPMDISCLYLGTADGKYFWRIY